MSEDRKLPSILPFDRQPDAVNEAGHKFWLDKSTTQYARDKGLADVQVLFVERSDGYQTRIIAQGGEAIYEDQSLEGIGVQLDIMAITKEPHP